MEHLHDDHNQPKIYSHEDCNALGENIANIIEREYHDGGICGLNVQSNSWEEAPRMVFTLKNEEYYPTLVNILREYLPEDMDMQLQVSVFIRQR